MKECLFVLLLFTGVISLVLSLPRKYRVIQQGKTWSDAQAYCKAAFTNLATISTTEDMVSLQNTLQAQQFSSGAWIGLYTNINSWYWSFQNESLGSFTNFANNEPNDMLGNERCVCILNGFWYDAPCIWSLDFVCFDGTKTGPDSYILITQAMTWYDAQSYCRKYHTDLVSVRNAEENSIVGRKNYNDFTWIGLIRDTWKWSDQTTNVSIINWWGGGSYNDYQQNKSCGYLSNSQAYVASCSDKMPFICYSPLRQRQIVRVKVKPTQDVNNSNLMTAIMEKIEQKLKDHGMAVNTTMKWRKQPDGMVFYKQKGDI